MCSLSSLYSLYSMTLLCVSHYLCLFKSPSLTFLYSRCSLFYLVCASSASASAYVCTARTAQGIEDWHQTPLSWVGKCNMPVIYALYHTYSSFYLLSVNNFYFSLHYHLTVSVHKPNHVTSAVWPPLLPFNILNVLIACIFTLHPTSTTPHTAFRYWKNIPWHKNFHTKY